MISSLLLHVQRFIPTILYAIRIITMRSVSLLWVYTSVLATGFSVIFALAAGLSQSMQRALFMLLMLNFGPFLNRTISISRRNRLVATWLLQCLFFPVHLYSLSNLLTWSGSLILQGMRTSRFRKSFLWSLAQDIKIQSLFSALSFIVFGELGLLSIVANLLLVPIFSGALGLAVISLFFDPDEFVGKIALWIQMSLLSWIRDLSAWQSEHPWLTLRCPPSLRTDAPVGQLVLAALLGAVAYRIWKLHEKEVQ